MSKALLRRRELLFQLGASAFLAVPVFRDTLREAGAASPLRFIVMTFPGGVRMPADSAVDYESSALSLKPLNFDFNGVLSGLAPLQSDMLLINGIGNLAMAPDNGHVPQSVLTGDSRGQAEGNEFIPADANSIDQVIAQGIGNQTRFASLQLGVLAGDQQWCYHSGSPLTAVSNPSVVFTRLFGGGVPTAGTGTPTPGDTQAAAAAERLRALRQSSLDQFTREVQAIKTMTGSAEQQKLDLHLTSIRELEKGLPMVGGGTGTVSMPSAGCVSPTLGSGSDVPTVTASMNELLFQAVNCDLTRVATLQWFGAGDDTESLTFMPGVTSARSHHTMQHAPDPEFDVVQSWVFSKVMGSLLQKLKNTPDGAGTMLDNSVVLAISNMSDGRYHMGNPFIGFVAGKGGGKIQTGRTISAGNVALNDLFVSLANVMGVNVTTVGEAKFNKAPVNLA